jgi:hypothetical protein
MPQVRRLSILLAASLLVLPMGLASQASLGQRADTRHGVQGSVWSIMVHKAGAMAQQARASIVALARPTLTPEERAAADDAQAVAMLSGLLVPARLPMRSIVGTGPLSGSDVEARWPATNSWRTSARE